MRLMSRPTSRLEGAADDGPEADSADAEAELAETAEA